MDSTARRGLVLAAERSRTYISQAIGTGSHHVPHDDTTCLACYIRPNFAEESNSLISRVPALKPVSLLVSQRQQGSLMAHHSIRFCRSAGRCSWLYNCVPLRDSKLAACSMSHVRKGVVTAYWTSTDVGAKPTPQTKHSCDSHCEGGSKGINEHGTWSASGMVQL